MRADRKRGVTDCDVIVSWAVFVLVLSLSVNASSSSSSSLAEVHRVAVAYVNRFLCKSVYFCATRDFRRQELRDSWWVYLQTQTIGLGFLKFYSILCFNEEMRVCKNISG